MVQIARRSFLIGLASLVTAPAIVKVSSLMPVKAMEPLFTGLDSGSELHQQYMLTLDQITKEAIRQWRNDCMFYHGEQWVKTFVDSDNVLRMRTVSPIAVNRLPTLERRIS